jgi:hypothetical protein
MEPVILQARAGRAAARETESLSGVRRSRYFGARIEQRAQLQSPSNPWLALDPRSDDAARSGLYFGISTRSAKISGARNPVRPR